jgi:hypothetical protein
MMNAQLNELVSLLKVKNPSLLKALQKNGMPAEPKFK